MTAVHSSRWYRAAALKPCLVVHVEVRRQFLRGQRWVLLSARGAGKTVRLNEAAYAIAGRFDGRRTVQALWDQLLGSGQDPPTQDEVIELLARLGEAALVHFDGAEGDPAAPADAAAAPAAASRGGLLSWRIRLGDPTPLLNRLTRLGDALFSPLAAAAWMVGVGMLLLLALQHAPELAAHAAKWLATPRYALLGVLLYVPVKLLHELAHGLAVRRFGGMVRAAGVTVMLGLPVPWVDASAAGAFARRRQRVLVGAAGMMAELALASIALPLWLTLDDGLVRDALFVTLFIAGVSTLLFNANPLQRFDGYYIATDALALPNLGPRSRQWWVEALRQRLLGLDRGERMSVAPGERKWLVAYAPLSWGYAAAISIVTIAWLGHLSFVLGGVGGAVVLWQLALRPPLALLADLRRAALVQPSATRRWRRALLGGGALLALALLVPLPQRTRVQGIVWPPEDAQLRADEGGFVTALHAVDGARVTAGDVVIELADPALQAQLAAQTDKVSALEATLFQALPDGSNHGAGGDANAGDAQAELDHAQAELDRLRERAAALRVRARRGGTLMLPKAADLQGSYLQRGALIGQVVGGEPETVRVALPESEAGQLAQDPEAVSVRLAASRWQAHPAHLLHDGSGAIWRLPNAALSQHQGGPIATEPQDPQDLKPLEPVVLLDFQLDAPIDGERRLGERAWVRIDAGHVPAVIQLARTLRREMRRRFNPQQ